MPKNVVSLYSEEERARKQRLSPLFWALYNGHFSSEIKFFLVASGKFLRAVGARAGFSRIFFGPPVIKRVKVFRAKKVGI